MQRLPSEPQQRQGTLTATILATTLLALVILSPTPADALTVVRSVGADGGVPTASDNDFLRLDLALKTVPPGEMVLLEGIFDWSEPHARASWALGSDGTGGTADDYRLTVPAGLDGVSLGASQPGVAIVAGPGDLPERDLETWLFFPGPNRGWTLSNLILLDFDLGVDFSTSALVDFDGTTFQGNYVRVATDLNRDQAPADTQPNYGLRLATGQGQTVMDNVFEIPGTGVSDGAAFSKSAGIQVRGSSPMALDGLLVEGNSFQVSGRPIGRPGGELIGGFEDQSAAHASNITVRNNELVNLDPGNVSLDNQETAFVVRAQSGTASTVLYQGNRVEGAEAGVVWTLSGGFTGGEPVLFIGNTFIDGDRAFVVGSGGTALLRCNRILDHTRAIDILRDDGTVLAERNWWGCNTGPDTPGCVPLTLPGTKPIPTSPWLVLSVLPATVAAGESTPLSAGFTLDSDGQPVDECSVPDGIPVSFEVAEGTLSASVAGTVDGVSTVLYTAENQGKPRTVDVTARADNAAAAGSIQVVPPGQSGQ